MRVTIFVICCFCTGLVSGLQLFLTNTKHTAHSRLTEAGNKANHYGSQAFNELLEDISEKYGSLYIRRETDIQSKISQFLSRLEPTLTTGVDNIVTPLNITLDRLGHLLNGLKYGDLFYTRERSIADQVDDVIGEGRQSTEEVSVDLFQSILHIMGEYFKGYRMARSLSHQRPMQEIQSEIYQVAENTFNIIHEEAESILEDIEKIGNALKESEAEARVIYARVQEKAKPKDIKSILQYILNKRLSGLAPSIGHVYKKQRGGMKSHIAKGK